jgi:hypothetical protein
MIELGGGMIAVWSLTIKDGSTTFRRNSELLGIFESLRVQNLCNPLIFSERRLPVFLSIGD